MSITVLLPENLYSAPLRALLEPLLPPGSVIRRPEDGMEDLQNRRLLFAVALDPSGCNLAYYGMLRTLRGSDTLLRGSVAGVIVTGVGEFYTKDVARDMVFAANQAGCAFLGRPLVEATGSLRNFRIQAQIGGVDEKTAFRLAVRELIARLDGWRPLPPVRRGLALHASQCSTSNTLALWELVKAALPPEIAVEEVGLRNGTVPDCNGCSYTACLHFGEQGSCFYGGPMVEEVLTDLLPLAEKKKITLAQEGGNVRMTGSDILIYRVLYNLVENGIKYNKQGGSVTISYRQEENMAVIHVTDTGQGIPEKCQSNIFQPFYRIDKSRSREYGGVGLGLSFAWESVRLHGGSISVLQSTPEGSTIEVELPV